MIRFAQVAARIRAALFLIPGRDDADPRPSRTAAWPDCQCDVSSHCPVRHSVTTRRLVWGYTAMRQADAKRLLALWSPTRIARACGPPRSPRRRLRLQGLRPLRLQKPVRAVTPRVKVKQPDGPPPAIVNEREQQATRGRTADLIRHQADDCMAIFASTIEEPATERRVSHAANHSVLHVAAASPSSSSRVVDRGRVPPSPRAARARENPAHSPWRDARGGSRGPARARPSPQGLRR